ncbi:MAG: methyltransferase family protein [Reyranella sp.]
MSFDLPALLRWGPFVLLVLYAAAFVAGTLRVAKESGGPVYVLDADATQRVSQAAFRLSFAVLLGVFTLRAGWPFVEQVTGPLEWAHSSKIQLLGLVVMLEGVVVAALAQFQMGHAWRIGVPDREPSQFVERGLFMFSRNPVFLGMAGMFLGGLLAAPSALTLMAASLALFAMSIQIRLEEAHLSSMLGSAYEAYKTRVRRWI